MAIRQVYNNFFIGTLVEISGATMNSGCVYLAEDTDEFFGVNSALEIFPITGLSLSGGTVNGDINLTSGHTFTINNVEVQSDKNYIYNQGLPAPVWNINHGLNKFPSITVINSANETVEGHINYIDGNNVILTFNGAFSGDAIFN